MQFLKKVLVILLLKTLNLLDLGVKKRENIMAFPLKCKNNNYDYLIVVGEYNSDGSLDIYNHADTVDSSDMYNPDDIHIDYFKDEKSMEESGWIDD